MQEMQPLSANAFPEAARHSSYTVDLNMLLQFTQLSLQGWSHCITQNVEGMVQCTSAWNSNIAHKNCVMLLISSHYLCIGWLKILIYKLLNCLRVYITGRLTHTDFSLGNILSNNKAPKLGIWIKQCKLLKANHCSLWTLNNFLLASLRWNKLQEMLPAVFLLWSTNPNKRPKLLFFC